MVGIRILNVRQKQFAKLFPVKNIDTHGSKIALWFFRFFFEVNDTSAFVGIHDTETAGFFQWNLNDSDGGISTACLVVSKHFGVIHFISRYSGEKESIKSMFCEIASAVPR